MKEASFNLTEHINSIKGKIINHLSKDNVHSLMHIDIFNHSFYGYSLSGNKFRPRM
jgi:hypothetical protein